MSHLRTFLNQLQSDYHKNDYLQSDPLEFVHRYRNPWDQEAVALISAVLAYGRVTQIKKSLEDVLFRINRISEGPADFVRRLERPPFLKQAQETFGSFYHRFNCGSDVVHLFWLLNKSWSKHQSLGQHLIQSLDPTAENMGPALSALILEWKHWLENRGSPSLSYLLTSPADGSCCKRWCMLLRWMGRHDHLDLGLWGPHGKLLTAKTQKEGLYLKTNQLVMPLDTHTGRICQYLGLTQRKTLNWKAALEITKNLKRVDPNDPTRYDFALSRLGILDICQRTYRKEICQKCQLLPACQFAQKHSNGPSLSMPAAV